MHESDDHLSALLKQAADAAQNRTVPAPAAEIFARGARHRRRRFAVIAAAACLSVGAVTGVATATLTPSDRGGRVEPATDLTPNPPPVPSESGTVEPGPGESTVLPPGPGESTVLPPGPGESTVLPPGPGGSATGQPPGPGGSATFPPTPGDSATMTSNLSG